MHRFIMFVGAVTAIIGVVLPFQIVSASESGATLLVAIWVSAGIVLSGAVLYSFGSIVDHLIKNGRHLAAIKASSEETRQIIADRLGKTGFSPVGTKRCHVCHAESELNAKNCRQCGNPLRTAA